MNRIVFLFILLLCCTISINTTAQTMITTQPRVSQKAVTGQTIGISDIYVKYHRPAVKDREVWGNLVPFGQVWRAGANENTIIKFSNDVMIGGQALAAGKYGLHMMVNEENVEVIFSKESSAWGSYTYDPAKDAARIMSALEPSNAFHEHLTYAFENVTPNSATCALYWGDMKIPFTVEVDVHPIVLANLREELQLQAGWSWIGWNEAANYCLQNKVNMEEARQWAARSVFINPNTNNIVTLAKLDAVQVPEDQFESTFVSTASKSLEAGNTTWKEYHGLANYAMQNNMSNETAKNWLSTSIGMKATMTNMMAMSKLLTASGDIDNADKYKSKAIEKGTNAELNAYGYQLLFAGQAQDALEIFIANTEKNPKDPNVFDSLGECYVNLGMHEKAKKAFFKSLSMNPPPQVKANSLRLLKQIGVENPEMMIKS